MATIEGGLQKQVGELYDGVTDILEGAHGEHVHLGFYEPGASSTLADHRAATDRMIEEILRFAGISDDPAKKPKRIVDVGCGIGGSSRYLAKKYGAQVEGITLSPVQVQRANALNAAAGLGDKVSFQVADALAQPFPDGHFDLVWSLDSGDHMPDKTKFVSEMARVAKPGATIILVTFCHRDLSHSEDSLTPDETHLLNTICEELCLGPWCSASDYIKIAKPFSLQNIKTADWTEKVGPFFPNAIRSVLSMEVLPHMLKSGPKALKFYQSAVLMMEGFTRKLIKYSIITYRKIE